jgi:hypothetical protein
MIAKFYIEVGKRHAQFQDGAITFSELCNSLISLGIREEYIILTEGELHDTNKE